jgi:hypothetical protein
MLMAETDLEVSGILMSDKNSRDQVSSFAGSSWLQHNWWGEPWQLACLLDGQGVFCGP